MAPPSTTATGKGAKPAKKESVVVTAYLVLYNAALAAGWAYVLWLAGLHLSENEWKWEGVYDAVEFPLKIAQTAAILEIVHPILGLVKTSVVTTMIQVASRLFILWAVADGVPAVRGEWAFTTMVVSWAITEVIRYGHYTAGQLGLKPYVLLWLRYTLFFVLYPTGAGSEALLAYAALQTAAGYFWASLVVVLFLYIPFFPYLYFHMITQRGRQLGGDSSASAGGKTKKTH